MQIELKDWKEQSVLEKHRLRESLRGGPKTPEDLEKLEFNIKNMLLSVRDVLVAYPELAGKMMAQVMDLWREVLREPID